MLGRKDNRRRLFDTLAESGMQRPLSDLHINIFLLLLISGAALVAIETSDLEQQSAWKATHVGELRFRSIVTEAELAEYYADALAHSKLFVLPAGTKISSQAGRSADTLRYWHEIEVEARAELHSRFPDTPDNDDALKAEISTIDGIERVLGLKAAMPLDNGASAGNVS